MRRVIPPCYITLAVFFRFSQRARDYFCCSLVGSAAEAPRAKRPAERANLFAKTISPHGVCLIVFIAMLALRRALPALRAESNRAERAKHKERRSGEEVAGG